MMIRTRLGAFACVAALGLTALPATAAPRGRAPSQTVSATKRFDAAQKLFDHGSYAEALEIFQGVYADTKSPNAHLMMARCLMALDRLVEAYDELTATMREAASRAEKEAKYAPARDAAAAQMALLEPKVGKLVITVADPSARVMLNDVQLGEDRLGQTIAVMPGPNTLVAERPDGTRVRSEQIVGAGETKKIGLSFPATTSAELAKAPPTPPPPAEEPHGAPLRTAGFVVTGIGVAGLATFGVAELLANGKYSSLQATCKESRCPDSPATRDLIASGRTMDLVANIGLIAGITGIVGGGAMILLGWPPGKANVGFSASPQGASLSYGGTF